MTYEANLMKRLKALDEHLQLLKDSYVKHNQLSIDIQHRNSSVSKLVEPIDVVEHKELQATIKGIVETLRDVNSHAGCMGERVGSICAIEVERFQAKLKSLRQYVGSQRKENKKSMKKDGNNVYHYKSENDQARVIRETKLLEERLYADLQDLKSIVDEYVHAQLLYHSKCFEAWAKLYQKCKRIDKGLTPVSVGTPVEAQQPARIKRVLSLEEERAGATPTNTAASPHAGPTRTMSASAVETKHISKDLDDSSDEEEETPVVVKSAVPASSELPQNARTRSALFQSGAKKSVVLGKR
jgi:hypothetical protein